MNGISQNRPGPRSPVKRPSRSITPRSHWAATFGDCINNRPTTLIGMIVVGLLLMQSPKVAAQWERGVMLRLGRFTGLRGPGLFWVIPFIDSVSSWIDQRTITTSFAAEQTLTSDTVPVNVDAVLCWMVHDV